MGARRHAGGTHWLAAGALAWLLGGATASCGRCGAVPPADGGASAPMDGGGSAALSPAGPDVVAMLGGLSVGEEVDGWRVARIGAVRADGGVPIELTRGGTQMRLLVTLIPEDDDPRAPAQTSRYAVYYENPERGKGASKGDSERVAQTVAGKIRAAEAMAPVPAGMTQPRKSGQPS